MVRTATASLAVGAFLMCGVPAPLSAQAGAAPIEPYPWPSEPAPASGIGAVVVGAAALGLGALQLATLPICFVDLYPDAAERACVISSIVLGGVGLTVGIPSLIVGLRRRRVYKAWRQHQRSFQQVSPFAGRAGAGVRYSVRF